MERSPPGYLILGERRELVDRTPGVRRIPPANTLTTMSTSAQTELLKLSREQLKQLCRERGHTGYSKCTKPQLVALLGSDTPSKFNSSMVATVLPPKRDPPSLASASRKRSESGSSGPGESVAKKQKRPNPIPSSNNSSVKSSTVSAPPKAKQKPRFDHKLPIPRGLFVPPVPTVPPTVPFLDQQPTSLPSVSSLLPSSPLNHLPSLPQPTTLQTAPNSRPHCVAEKYGSGTSLPSSGGKGRTQSFKKLDSGNKATNNYLVPRGSQGPLHSANMIPCPNVSMEQLPPPYLDFSTLPVPSLDLIGMPPSISDRKKANSWSIILSGISNTERRACTLVSRMFRYAGKSALCSLSLGYLISTLR